MRCLSGVKETTIRRFVRSSRWLAALTVLTVCCSSCFIPFATRQKLELDPGAINIERSDDNAEISQALILVLKRQSRLAARRMNDAFVFNPATPFPMYHEHTIYLSGPCPQAISENSTSGFIVLAPGYAPTYFVPDRSGGVTTVHWALNPVSKEQSKRAFDQLNESLGKDVVHLENWARWGVDDNLSDLQWGKRTEKPIRVSLSKNERRLIKEFIDASLEALE